MSNSLTRIPSLLQLSQVSNGPADLDSGEDDEGRAEDTVHVAAGLPSNATDAVDSGDQDAPLYTILARFPLNRAFLDNWFFPPRRPG
jgi:hypothetical protein